MMVSARRMDHQLLALVLVATSAALVVGTSAERQELDYEDDYAMEDIGQTINDAVESITKRLTILEEELSRCSQTNLEKLSSTLDEKFSEMTQILLANLTEVRSAPYPDYTHSDYHEQESPQPACLPPFEKKSQIGCIWLSDTELTWRYAKKKCEDMNARLIVNPPQATLLHYITEKHESGTSFWVGAKYSDAWRWLDTAVIRDGWNHDEPDFKKNSACAYFNWNGEGLLNDHLCKEKKRFICEVIN